MELRLEKIASIVFRHEYFKTTGLDWATTWPNSYSYDQIPTVEPTPSTSKSLSNYGLYLRNTDGGIEIYAAVTIAGNEFVVEKTISGNPILYFYLRRPNLDWLTYTKMDEGQHSLATYSNLEGLKTNQGLFLHDEITDAAPGEKPPGKLVRSGNIVYEAKKRTSSQPSGAAWTSLGTQTNYTTLSNKIGFKNGFLKVVDENLDGATVSVIDTYENVVFTKSFEAGNQEKETSIAIDHLPEGIYTWRFNGTEKERFYLASSIPTDTVAIICICLQHDTTAIPPPKRLTQEWLPIANGSGSLPNGAINPREFIIHFLAKRAIWKYNFSKELSISPSDVPPSYKKINTTTYQSKDPIEIKRTAIGADFGLDQRLPAASAGILTPQLNASEELESYVSEIYVNV